MKDGRQPREGNKPQAVVVAKATDSGEVGRVRNRAESPANTWVTPVESEEPRDAAKGKVGGRNTSSAQNETDVHTYLARLGRRAKEKPEEKFSNLLSHIKVPLLKEAYERLNQHAAPGVDGETWISYGEGLEARLQDLEGRIHRGSYHPQPVRRVHIPKPDGRTRPLGIPALEDKVVQQAVRMLLEPIYESQFQDESYGFRPGRSQHDALDKLYEALYGKTNWVLDADIASFFDSIDHEWMRKLIEHRIGDKRLVRLIMKWLHAGVLEDGTVHEMEEGTPQGGSISPLLANIFLHYVLDLWVGQWRKRQAHGELRYVRYADDFVIAFQRREDAQACREQLAQRLEQFKLHLHPDKTRIIRFGRFARADCEKDGRTRPETFDFLGFTHICAQGNDGRYRLIRRTSGKKRRSKLKALRRDIARRKHEPAHEQLRWLSSVLLGHYQYYGVPTNLEALASFRRQVQNTWHFHLQRRSQRARWNNDERLRFANRYPLPAPRITHPHPFDRLGHRLSPPLT